MRAALAQMLPESPAFQRVALVGYSLDRANTVGAAPGGCAGRELAAWWQQRARTPTPRGPRATTNFFYFGLTGKISGPRDQH